MIVCKNCGFENEEGAQFCGSCGSFLEWTGQVDEPAAPPPPVPPPTTPAPTTPPPPATTTPPTQPVPVGQPAPALAPPATAAAAAAGDSADTGVVCPACGTKNEAGRVYCRRCATELVPTVAPVVAPPPTAGRGAPPVPVIAAALVGLAGLGLVAFLLFGPGNGGPSPTQSGTAQGSASPSPSVSPSVSPSSGSSESPSAPVSPSASAPPSGTIIWSSRGSDGDADLWIAAPDGSGAKQLVGTDGNDFDPFWSPESDRFAYSSPQGIIVATADGKPDVDFTHHAADVNPAWSPDGETIAFASRRLDNQLEVYTRRFDALGEDPVRLTNQKGPDWDPSWSPEGDQLAFVSQRGGDADIWIMDPADPAKPAVIRDDAAAQDDPAWSPKGDWIAYASDEKGTFGIWLMRPDGSEAHPLTTPAKPEHDPAWSPDGRFLTFTRGLDDAVVVVIDIDGKEIATFGEPGGVARMPSWG